MNEAGFEDSYNDWHEVLLAEISGNIDKAKVLALECANSSMLDTIIVFGVCDFFMRYNFNSELVEFYMNVHSLIRDKKRLIEGLKDFYGRAVQFLIDECYEKAIEIFDELPCRLIGEEEYHKSININTLLWWTG